MTLASVTPLSAAPVLSWISSTATMSGALRLLISVAARPANLVAGSLGLRFSTLNDAISSSFAFGVSGLLYQSNLLLYDRRAERGGESLWSQLQARAIAGPATPARSIIPIAAPDA